MLLLPRMLQSIQILQLPGLELDAFLREAAEGNEALLVEDAERVEPPEPLRPRRLSRESSDRHDEWLQNQPDRKTSPIDALVQQLALIDLDATAAGWAQFLVRCIDSNGYLSLGDEELLARANAEGLEGGRAQLVNALAVLRTLEPRGIGARNAIEALLLQLDGSDPQYTPLCRLLGEFLGELSKNHLPGIARAMDLSVDEVRALLARLAELDPRPASQLVEDSAPGIVPDVVVERDGDGFQVRVEHSNCPTVRVDPDISKLARDRAQQREVRSYLRGKIDRARWIVDAVEQRGRTLTRIAQAVFAHQHAFLEHGAEKLAPLKMTDLAGELGLHVSTVSRAVAGKYAQTPQGILPLRHFFQAAGADPDSTRDGVREQVKHVFDGEDHKAPLSDDDVVEVLHAQGLVLARRTVAKYRKELGIASSYLRRQF